METTEKIIKVEDYDTQEEQKEADTADTREYVCQICGAGWRGYKPGCPVCHNPNPLRGFADAPAASALAEGYDLETIQRMAELCQRLYAAGKIDAESVDIVAAAHAQLALAMLSVLTTTVCAWQLKSYLSCEAVTWEAL
jgi:hypothetical protein